MEKIDPFEDISNTKKIKTQRSQKNVLIKKKQPAPRPKMQKSMRDVFEPKIMESSKQAQNMQTENMDIHEFMRTFANNTYLDPVDENGVRKARANKSRSKDK